MTFENEYPELANLRSSEVFVAGFRLVKDDKMSIISIGRVIARSGQKEMRMALKSQLNADNIYLLTVEK